MSSETLIMIDSTATDVRAQASLQSRWRYELGLIAASWRRDVLHLLFERSRWFGLILQPFLFWIIIGSGIAKSLQFKTTSGIDYLTFFYPGTLIMMVLFTTIFATISVIEDRQNGFLQGVLVAPGSRVAMIIGKLCGVTTIALVQAAIYLLAAPAAKFSWANIHWIGLAAILILSCVGLTAINFTMAWVLRSAQSYHALMGVILMPLWVISGAMFPVPEHSWLRIVMVFNPMSYSVWGSHAALAGGSSSVAHVSLVHCAFVLACFAVFGVTLAAFVSRRGNGATR